MQNLVVAVMVVACLLAVLRGAWKQFNSQGAGGCGGCGSASACVRPKDAPCGGTSVPAAVQVIRWHRKGGTVSVSAQK
jgi:hypothetical protein